MIGSGAIDWDDTTHGERKLLFKPANTLKKSLHIDWKTVFQRAFGLQDNVGSNYEDNLRKGMIAPQRAYKIFIWLLENDPVLASDIEDNILALRASNSPEHSAGWEAMMAMGRFSNVEVYKCKDALGMAQFARRQPVHHLKLKLLEEFIFEITIPFDGTLIAFQGYKGIWHPQSIAEGTAVIAVAEGKHVLPSDDDNKPDPLWEETDTGKHGFAFLLIQDQAISQMVPPITHRPHGIPVKIRDTLAHHIIASPEKSWKLFRINLMFE